MKRKCLFLFLLFSLFVFAFWLGAWTARAERYAHYTPEYARLDIVPILQKENLKEADYKLLFLQTGITQAGVVELREKGKQSALLLLQERFFADVELECLRSNLIVQSERLVSANVQAIDAEFSLPTIQNGDILISFSGHVFGWRNGHAAIVVDAEKGLTLEATTLGSVSRFCDIEKWAEYPCFALLRLKGITAEDGAEIAEYAGENLVGISYRLLSFAGDGKVATSSGIRRKSLAEEVEESVQEALNGTHCAHLVWTAYAHFGYNLDSDGGLVVTPRDIFDSDLLEVVQIYGLNPTVVEME